MENLRTARLFAIQMLIAAMAAGTVMAQTTTIKTGGTLAENSSMYYISEQNILPYDRYLKENTPPLVHDVKISPESPGPEDEITITAEIKTDPMLTENKTLFAFVNYSLDGGETWEEVEMDQEGDNSNLWTAVIPPTGASGEFPYYFTAEDDAGNYLTELPQAEIKWGAKEHPNLLARIPDKNNDARLVENDLDILEARAGYDGENYYFGFKVEGKISSGTVTPFEPSIYSIGIFLPNPVQEQQSRPDYVLEHSQHAQFVLFPVVGLLDIEENFSEIATADPRFYYDDEWLFLRMNPAGISEDFDNLKIIFGTSKGISYIDIQIKTMDVTGFVNIVPSARYLEVE